MPIQSVSLKNVKHHRGLSEETNAFDAVLYVDGVKVGRAYNSGKGGENDVVLDLKFQGIRDELHAWAKTQPAFKGSEGDLPMDLDLYLSLLVDADILEKEAKKYFLNHLCFKDSDNRLRVSKKMAKDQIKAYHDGKGQDSLPVDLILLKSPNDVLELLKEGI